MKNILSLIMLLYCACTFSQSANYEQELKDADAFVAADPSASSFYQRGYLEFRNNDFQKAMADFNKAIALDPESFESYYSRGNLKEKLEDFKGAIEDFSKCIGFNDESSKSYFSRGYVKSITGDLVGAIEDYSTCIRLNPKHKGAFLNRGISRKNQNQFREAILDYDEAIAIDPNFSDAYQNRAIAKALINDKTAIDDFNFLVDRNPSDGEVYYNRAAYLINNKIAGDFCADLKKASQYGYGGAVGVFAKNCNKNKKS